MIKRCPVILNNEYVTVVKYGKTKIQFPSIQQNKTMIYVKCEDEKYYIVPDCEMNQMEKNTKKRKTTKQKSVKENAENNTDLEAENA